MDEASDNRLREMRATFNLQGAQGPASRLGAAAPKQYRAKVFKSGNSLALRLPKALGLEAGMEMEISSDGLGGYSVRQLPAPGRKFDIDSIWGIGADLGLQPIKPEDRMFDEVKRPWDDPDWPGWSEGDA